MQARLIVHGGAWNIPQEYEADHLEGVRRAVAEVFPKLQDGASALDAVEAAVRILEEDPTFNAGRGAVLNAVGEIELDAMIMDGATLNLGAVAALQNILHPVTVARLVMEHTDHCLLVGAGAQRFARQMGVAQVPPEELVTERELEVYHKIRRDPTFRTIAPFQSRPAGPTTSGEADADALSGHALGTVGAVAMDNRGNLAAATSTGGTAGKLPGRVGDSPLAGAGTYADNTCGAASATGWGEAVIRTVLAKTACDWMGSHPAQVTAERAVEILRQRVQGLAGIILIDRRGGYGLAHSTSKMAFAYAEPSGKILAHIKKEIS
jgi:beta-aspartyl-peptidase (threonine type)